MSGQATGWVLRHGPRPEMVDSKGRAYGQRARGLRAVLVTIADAANRDGEHSHPGLTAMIEGSLYGRSQVLALVKQLVEDGWVGVEEEGRGRGHATVYGIPRMVHSSDLSSEGKGPVSTAKRSDLKTEKVQSEGSTPLSPTDTTKDSTREEAIRLCGVLSELMVGNGCRPPNVTETWIVDMERMIRIDGRTPSQIENAIRWCQADKFWCANVLSPRKLREKYDQLRLAAKSKNGHNGTAPRTPIADHLKMEFDDDGSLVR